MKIWIKSRGKRYKFRLFTSSERSHVKGDDVAAYSLPRDF